jgi:hypothetical protein
LLALHGFLAQSPSPVGDDTLVVDHASRLWHVGEACGELLERDACAHGGGDVAAFLATELRLAYAIGLAISDEVPTRVTAFAMPDDRPMYLEFSVTSVPRTHGDSRPRACIIAVADITAGYTHKPFEKRAPIVASAVRRWGYDRMRVYRISPDGHYLVGVAEVGGHNLTREFAGYRILIHDKDHLRSAIATMSPQIIRMADIDSEKRELPVFKDLSKVTDFIMFPLARDGVVSGWATVDNGNSRKPLGATSVDEVLPAVRELEAALRATSAPEAGPVGDDPLPRILDRMAGAFTPEEMMQALLHGLRAELGIEFAHVRVRRNGHAEMVARAGSYAEQRPRLLPMDGMFWSVRAILTGERRLCQNAAVLEPDSFPETSEWTRAAEAIFQKHVGSFGVFPIAFGDTFAAAALMAPSEGFFKPDRVLIIESALRVAAIMWGDLTRDKERRAAELRKVVVQVAHSMNDPLLQAEDALRHRPDIASECDGANLGRAVHRMRQYYAMIM